MNTDDLIDQLGADLAPVERLPRPGRSASFWLLGSVLYLGVIALVAASIVSPAGGRNAPFLATQLLGVVAAGLAAWAAFASVIPGYSRVVLLAAGVVVVAWFASSAMLAVGGGLSATNAEHEWVCVSMILIGGAPLVAAMGAMLGKGAPLNPMLTGLLVALAVGLLGNFAACIATPHDDVDGAVLWHAGSLAALVVLCVFASRFVLRWGGR